MPDTTVVCILTACGKPTQQYRCRRLKHPPQKKESIGRVVRFPYLLVYKRSTLKIFIHHTNAGNNNNVGLFKLVCMAAYICLILYNETVTYSRVFSRPSKTHRKQHNTAVYCLTSYYDTHRCKKSVWNLTVTLKAVATSSDVQKLSKVNVNSCVTNLPQYKAR